MILTLLTPINPRNRVNLNPLTLPFRGGLKGLRPAAPPRLA